MADDKRALLDEIAREVGDLSASPLYAFRVAQGYRPVIGDGDPDAEIMFIGEAPGLQEARSGKPFVGNAGRVLDEMLTSIGLHREDVYITSVVKDRPPGNRDPHVGEIRLYKPFLLRQVEIIRPRVIATLGRFAMDVILDEFGVPEAGGTIGELHGRRLVGHAPHGDATIVPLYHPAATFYSADARQALEEDFRALRDLL